MLVLSKYLARKAGSTICVGGHVPSLKVAVDFLISCFVAGNGQGDGSRTGNDHHFPRSAADAKT